MRKLRFFNESLKKVLILTNVILISLTFIALTTLVAVYAIKVETFDEENTIQITESEDYIDGKILIKYHKNGLTFFDNEIRLSTDIFEEYRETGVRLQETNAFSFIYDNEYIWYEAKLKDGVLVENALNSLKNTQNIVHVEPVYIRTQIDSAPSTSMHSNDPLLDEQDYLQQINIYQTY